MALIISIRSCSISQNALNLSQQEYLDKFKNVWTGTYDKENETLKIIPTNKNVVLQKATAYYPDVISDSEWPIRPPENILHITVPTIQIRRMIKDKFPLKKGFAQVLDTSRIPIIIESNYTLNGDNLYDVSVYMIEFNAVINDEENDLPKVFISGLIFSHQIKEDIKIKDYINDFWKNGLEGKFEK
ncbi:hypothetical protein [Winogradskyella damuponensis]|uniref:hypothetical protein n=1 Tax=Winogradskyella damuponensis TaxID=943939 RepID=UPI0031D5C99E